MKENEFRNLSKKELFNLKDNIDNRLKSILEEEKKEAKKKKKKEKIIDLISGDKIFGIRLSSGSHRLVDPKELNCEVDIIDYCKVEGNDIRTSGEYEGTFRLSISHELKSFGNSSTLDTKLHGDKHYVLFMDTSYSGYDSFYTLRPESWKEDLDKAYKELVRKREQYYHEELSKLDNKMTFFLSSEKKINEHIK